MPEDEKIDKVFQKGKNYALYLLNYRDLSRFEIYKKLKQKGYPELTIGKVIGYLEDSGLVDDKKFALKFTLSRVKKGFSSRKIKYLLKNKGIEEDIIDEVVKDVFSSIDEEKMARELLFKKRYLPLEKEIGKEEKIRHLSKIYRFLSSYGFSYSVIEKIVNTEIRTGS